MNPRGYGRTGADDERGDDGGHRSKGLGAIHALSHPVGAVFNTHHGTTNAVCMPAVLKLNAPLIRDRFDLAASYIGIEGGFDSFEFLQGFNDSLGIPRRLGEMGVTDDRMEDLVEMALHDPSCSGNPVTLTAENISSLFRDCI